MTTNDDDEAKRHELALLLEEEGWSPEDARGMADDGFTRVPEEADRKLNDLRARYPQGPRVKHTGEGIVDFITAQRQRSAAEFDAEIERDDAAWYALKDRLIQVMATSGVHPTSIIPACIRALVEVLMADGTSQKDALQSIAQSLFVWQDLTARRNQDDR